MSVCVIGASNVDILSRAYKLNSIIQDSHKGKIQISFGGVARNIAENLVRLGIPSSLLSVVAKDALGNILMEHIKNIVPFSIDYSHVLLLDDASTSCYNAFQNEQGEMLYAIADMDIVERMNVSYFSTKKKHIENSSFCVLETNISQESLDYIVHAITGPRYVVDTVSGAKAYKVRSLIDGIFLLKTNLSELASIIKELHSSYYQDIFYFIHNDTRTHCNENDMSDAKYNAFFSLLYEIGMLLISKGLDNLVVSLGKKGLWYITKNNGMSKYEYMYIDSNYLDTIQIKSTTGAGDSLCAGIVYALYNNYSLYEALEYGTAVAIHTIQSDRAVSNSIHEDLIQNLRLQIFPKK